MQTESVGITCGVPVRRSRWVSFWIGAAAVFVSLLLAAAAVAVLLPLSPDNFDGAAPVILFAFLWFGIFFFNLPRQRRYARALDLRRPGIILADNLLAIPLSDGLTLRFKLDEPHELRCGWFETLTPSAGGPTTNTRGFMTYAILSQAGQDLFLKAEDSVREARDAGWPNSTHPTTPALGVRLWASDLVFLVEALRASARPSPGSPS